MSAALDELAVALDRARAAHERRPNDPGAALAYERARADFLDASLRAREAELRVERGRLAQLKARIDRAESDFRLRLGAIVRAAKPEPRRRARGPASAPLLEGAA